MNAKKLVSYVLCLSAFKIRNITSILLVVFFFGVYVMAGGKITTPPKVGSPDGFGGLAPADSKVIGDVQEAKDESVGRNAAVERDESSRRGLFDAAGASGTDNPPAKQIGMDDEIPATPKKQDKDLNAILERLNAVRRPNE